MKILFKETTKKGTTGILYLEDDTLKLKLTRGKKQTILSDEKAWQYYHRKELKVPEVEAIKFNFAKELLEKKRNILSNDNIKETINAHLEELLKKLKFKFSFQKTIGAIEKYQFNKSNSTYGLLMEYNNQTNSYQYFIMLQNKETFNYYPVEVFDNEYDVIEYLEGITNWKQEFIPTKENIPFAFRLKEYDKMYRRGNIVIDKNFKLICRINSENKCVPIGRGFLSISNILFAVEDDNSWNRKAKG